ncbi:hypothetical protein DPM19_10225 [Actinomadura craniellae]|uniref:Uncharacterized protein n=1 Tax=Actinomadura craniellae TaxID=2231787 RepID=A0A365H7K4_9ACTN|nr:hypothetical protein [Actinomadura craniellae]RAY15100.1 hypothetical protein DPM19_10225 [Actinomadura craniellae]
MSIDDAGPADLNAVRETDALIEALSTRRGGALADSLADSDSSLRLLVALASDVDEGAPALPETRLSPPAPRGPRRRGARTVVAISVVTVMLTSTGVAAAGGGLVERLVTGPRAEEPPDGSAVRSRAELTVPAPLEDPLPIRPPARTEPVRPAAALEPEKTSPPPASPRRPAPRPVTPSVPVSSPSPDPVDPPPGTDEPKEPDQTYGGEEPPPTEPPPGSGGAEPPPTEPDAPPQTLVGPAEPPEPAPTDPPPAE